MSKKILSLACILVFSIFSIIGCAKTQDTQSTQNTEKPVTDLNYQASIKLTDTKDLKSVGNKLFSEYLNYYTKDNIENDLKLKSYKINDVAVKNKNNDSFEFMVDFSVEPVNDKMWLMPNGKKSGDWVNNKVLFVNAKINGNVYSIDQKATSPIN